ncbi:hypothetical protein Q3A66_01770 [Hymenobacter sp. BT770]|uniref:hypothetical protein n=1 Tax=Hymenobacter sp. BT770 TaxID=2886942 RepID=UPI0026734C3C|nr:hypothetical protein [Hymenobacter sp. BT770]MCC3151644.1 hypothetical protein [Hymenobacter sp. BT770]MDO3413779.1 hypothetical protein [Hymenobacter sp. BT770]
MRVNDKGFWLLVLVAVCLITSAWLPAHYKLLFVQETGNVGHSQTTNVVLILMLFTRWRYALTLTMFVSGLRFLFGCGVLWSAWKYGGPLLGYSLTTLLHLIVLKVLNDSTSIEVFLKQHPADNLGKQQI